MSRLSLPVAVTKAAERSAAEREQPPQAHFALLEVQVPRTFRPTHGRHVPPLVACWLSHRRARDLAIRLNEDELANNGRRWHVLVVVSRNGQYGVLRVSLPEKAPLPARADGLPGCLAGQAECATHWKLDALASADATNAAILRIARRPGVWNLPIRALTDPVPDPLADSDTTGQQTCHPQPPPGTPCQHGEPRQQHQEVDDWNQPARWMDNGHPVREGGRA